MRVVRIAGVAAVVLAIAATSAAPGFADNVVGTLRADRIEGTDSADTVSARAGNDVVRTHGGNDEVYGGRGADRLELGDGDDLACGGRGADQVFGGRGRDELYSGICHEGLVDVGVSDTLFGGPGPDFLEGPFMYGGAGADEFFLWSWVREQRAVGGPGDDRIVAHDFGSPPTTDRDVIRCGEGTDRVVYEGSRPDPADKLVNCESVVPRLDR